MFVCKFYFTVPPPPPNTHTHTENRKYCGGTHLHRAESFMRHWQILSCSRNSPYFGEPEDSLPCSQQPVTFHAFTPYFIMLQTCSCIMLEKNVRKMGIKLKNNCLQKFHSYEKGHCHMFTLYIPLHTKWGKKIVPVS
jgi:hypothetical protein